MAKQTPVLIKSFAADTAVASAHVCVVMSGTNSGNVALPGGALATKFVGVTQEPVSSGSATNEIAVQVAGIAQIQTDGSAAINAGDYVAIANASGQIKSITPASGTNVRQIVGIALSAATNMAG
ncbi:MAG TPA: capsid cement protein, partial [Chthonomonadales bacterium]|nr:capsid cement protein [Chthonomonadales bacterium]